MELKKILEPHNFSGSLQTPSLMHSRNLDQLR